MQSSSEIEAIVDRFFAAMNQRDSVTFINLHADEPGVVFIGTDPVEWWVGLDSLASINEAQMNEFEAGGLSFDLGSVDAFVEGTVGWAAARPTLLFPDGTRVSSRFTAVLHLDRGIWRFVQWHVSVGTENEEILGFEMTTSVEQLAAAVQEERPDLREVAAADGTITIAFSDIESSTDIAVRLGDHRWLKLLRWHDAIVSDCVTREGGQVVKSLGDGHMLAYTSARRALRSAIAIQQAFLEPHDGERLHLRIGLHTGDVLNHENDFFGHSVILAARIAAAAHGDEILVSSLVRDLTNQAEVCKFGEPRASDLKGIPGNHVLFPVEWREVPLAW